MGTEKECYVQFGGGEGDLDIDSLKESKHRQCTFNSLPIT